MHACLQHYDITAAQGNLGAVAAAANTYATLQQIFCNTADYEQATLWLLAALNNGSTYDVTTVRPVTGWIAYWLFAVICLSAVLELLAYGS